MGRLVTGVHGDRAPGAAAALADPAGAAERLGGVGEDVAGEQVTGVGGGPATGRDALGRGGAGQDDGHCCIWPNGAAGG
jgi:hypothetical protein